MRRAILSLALSSAFLVAGPLLAQEATPVGVWKSIDDSTGEPKALIQISEQDGQLQGRIVKLFRKPGEDPDPVCDECTDQRKGQKIVGMTILTGLQREGEEWTGGMILDPKNGKVYKAKAELEEGGDVLKVRGYLGFSLLGRTQEWQRQPESAADGA
ncbi:DUF2147 domain-containing protein [Coralloluteibacterium stylophorae]|uniref:DUF2147 domain-containing protein n=1 Tax=Coralloluteibacterium stylophorae TaxID=1776034 RepID=A0A8J8AYX7_9GAMM|nr:DUF2147 domain-containing protein [Coralloluteibacterium stylophorae]MBS7456212.1 DUF2147 domain-containing protein [Coralloluteibacterium stylophorae]